MVTDGKKILVALSGGVDSSTAAALLCRQGYDCAGAFVITSDQTVQGQAAAEKVAAKLDIKLYVLDLRPEFERIIDCFCKEYMRGRTPNPCVVCNRDIKFGKLWDFARSKEADLMATGHYARIIKNNKDVGLYAATDSAKDQSYALAMISRKLLGHIILPLGEYSKNQVREMAARFDLGVEQKQESQEICFIPDNDYIALLERRCPELVRRGSIINGTGKILGEHEGIHRFTIGQRQGLRVAMGKPYYVVKINAETHTVTLGAKEEVMQNKLSTSSLNWLIDRPKSAFRAKVKIRYNDGGAWATVWPRQDKAIVEFDGPVSAVTPGQLAVFNVEQEGNYRVAGGGWIG